MREASAALLRDVMAGAALGLLLLGVGGRVAMRVVAVTIGQPPAFGVGGTFTVVAAGTGAGAAGALLYAISRSVGAWLARRLAPDTQTARWARTLRLALFAVLLALVTARGLRGSQGPTWLFWLLVAAYGTALELMLARRSRHAEPDAPGSPRLVATSSGPAHSP